MRTVPVIKFFRKDLDGADITLDKITTETDYFRDEICMCFSLSSLGEKKDLYLNIPVFEIVASRLSYPEFVLSQFPVGMRTFSFVEQIRSMIGDKLPL